jgi:hypothetical protein
MFRFYYCLQQTRIVLHNKQIQRGSKLNFPKNNFEHIFTKGNLTIQLANFGRDPKLMHLHLLTFILLLFCLNFYSYGKESSPISDTIKFNRQFQKKALVSRNILFTGTSNRISLTHSVLNKSLDVQLYRRKQQPLTTKINFRYNALENATEIIPVINRNFKIPAINLHDSFLSKQSNTPLLRNHHAGIWKKVGRAELFIGGVELLGMGVLILMPKEVTKWPPNWAEDAWITIKESFSNAPVWDKDDWQLNYIGHPVAGSYYYNALRSQNASTFHSFLFCTAQSFIWEYVIEGMAESPSAQDLIVTPIAGLILGESTHQLTMTMRRNGFNFFEKVFVLIFNPMFVINNGFGPRFNPVKMQY